MVPADGRRLADRGRRLARASRHGWSRAAGFHPPPPGVGPGALWFRVVAAPYRAWTGMWQLVGHGQAGGAVVAVAPLAVPLGIAVGGLAWAYRLFRMRSGRAGSPRPRPPRSTNGSGGTRSGPRGR